MKIRYEFNDNTEEGQFEYLIGELVCKMEYSKIGNTYFLNHLKVPVELEGKGIGTILMKNLLQYIANRHELIVPKCSFAKKFLKKNPVWMKIVK
jgi:uncharacterized protein